MSHQPTIPPPLPPPNTPPPQYSLREPEELTTEAGYKQLQTLLEWLFVSVPGHRAIHTLPALHRITLIHGLSTLRQRITDLVDLDLKLFHKYAGLLSDREHEEKAFAYIGWCWFPPPDSTLEVISREELERLLWHDVSFYDEVAESARMWKKDIDGRLGQRPRDEDSTARRH